MSDVIIGTDRYIEFRYSNKNIGIFRDATSVAGEIVIDEHKQRHPIPFMSFLQSLISNNKDKKFNIYNSTKNPFYTALRNVVTFGHIPDMFINKRISPTSPLVDLKKYVVIASDFINSYSANDIIAEYVVIRLMHLLEQAESTEDAMLIYDRLISIYDGLAVSTMIAGMFSDKSAVNCIFYTNPKQFDELVYFFQTILLTEPVLQIPTVGYPIEERRHLSFLFRLSNRDYVKTFSDTPENCGPGRFRVLTEYETYLIPFCDVIPLDDVQYIYGPTSYTEHTDGVRNIAIFGEYHKIPMPSPEFINKRNTLAVPSLLKTILLSFPNTFYDLFLELGYTNKFIQRTTGITAFNNIFGSCLSVVKNCPFDNIRAHYTDYRTVISKPNFIKVLDKLYNYDDEFFQKDNLIYEFMMAIDIVTDLIATDRKLIKLHGSSIHKFIMRKIEFEREIFLADVDYESNSRLIHNIMRIYILVMDMYTLGRVLKEFKTTNPLQPSIAKNSIIYAGEAHAENYRDFLSEIGFTLTNKIVNEGGSRPVGIPLDFRTIKQRSFLFNTR